MKGITFLHPPIVTVAAVAHDVRSAYAMKRRSLGLLLVAAAVSPANAFYLPGAAPHDYHDGERVDLFVNALTPMIGAADNAKLVCAEYSANMGIEIIEPLNAEIID